MQFIYAIINFLILAGLLFLFGRRIVVSIFRGRRERIDSELDEVQRLNEEEAVIPQIPTVDELIDAERAQHTELHSEADAVLRDAEREAARINDQAKHEMDDMRRDAVYTLKNEFIDKIAARVEELMSSEPYVSELRALESELAHKILDEISLTPGDMAYLKYHDVLYVTLISAFELPRELVDEIGRRTNELLEKVGGKQSYWVQVDPSLIGGLRLRIGDSIYDCTVVDRIYNLKKALSKQSVRADETPEELARDILDGIDKTKIGVSEFQLGRVISISDGICWLDGLSDIMYGEVIEFECGERGMILDIEPDRIGCIVYGRYEHIESGSRVRRVGRIASVPVGDELLGRVVDPLGAPVDGKGKIWTSERRPIECRSPGIPDRSSVNRPMQTGIRAIDALVPIGKGQRELIIGDRQTGKTSIAVDTIINQKGKNVPCIYVAIGQKDTTVADIREKLTKYGAMEYTTIICAPASSSASLQYIAPFAGAAMAEYFMYSGRDALIIYDDLSKHAVAYRELSLLLHRPSGREAYPGDVFYLHSRLLERAAQLSPENGGGSMTALPIIETQAGDISAYIPTNVISITDGQIFLETDLFNEGQRPAVNVGLSVSRVGSSAQTKLMKQMSSNLRTSLAQYRELAGFAQFGSEVDADTKQVLESGERMMLALRQQRYSPMPDWKQALIIFAVSEKLASGISPEKMDEFEDCVCGYIENERPELCELLKTGKKLDEAGLTALRTALHEMPAIK